MCPPLPSRELAGLLRQHDIFVTATENDAYSNALVEALSCGLPAIYLESGGSARSRQGGRSSASAIARRFQPCSIGSFDEYEQRQASISLPSLEEIADQYLEALGLHEFVGRQVAGWRLAPCRARRARSRAASAPCSPGDGLRTRTCSSSEREPAG